MHPWELSHNLSISTVKCFCVTNLMCSTFCVLGRRVIHRIDHHFFWTRKVNILVKCTISNVGGARTRAKQIKLCHNGKWVQRYCLCELVCARVNMFVRLALKRATELHKRLLVPLNEDSLTGSGCCLWLCPRPYSHLFYPIVTEWLWNGNRLATWLTIIAGLFLSGHGRSSLPPCFAQRMRRRTGGC